MTDGRDGFELDDRDQPRHRHVGRWVAAALAVMMIAFVAVLATRQSAQDVEAASPLLGHQSPALEGTGIDGSHVSLAAFRGKWVVLNFFASWCVTCRVEHPQLIAFSQRHQAAGDAGIVGVTFDDRTADARRYMAQLGGDWPVVVDPDGEVALHFGVRAPPESYLLDPNGFVVSKIVGGVTADGLDRLLQRAEAKGA